MGMTDEEKIRAAASVNNHRLPTLFQAVGRSLLIVQHLELAIAQYLVMYFKISPGMAHAEAKAAFATEYKKTLGQLIAHLREKFAITLSTETLLKETLSERNWLA